MTLYRHKKRGTTYELLGFAKMQSENWMDKPPYPHGWYGPDPEKVDMQEVAVYVSTNEPKEMWVRPRDEFEDGRFEIISE